jgi:aspartate racemase
VPPDADQAAIHQIYLGELLEGVVRDDSRRRIVAAIEAMRQHDGIDGVILGGTELALTLTDPEYAGVPILDTSRIHAEAAVEWLLNRASDDQRPGG